MKGWRDMRRKFRKMAGYAMILARTGMLRRVPALYDALEMHPTSCNLMITNRCNLRCVMCGQWKEQPQKELETGAWKTIIRDLKDNRITSLHLTGGEPLLRSDTVELVAFASSLGFTVGMTTNGSFLSEETMRLLVDAGLRSIVISVDAVGKAYDGIRGIRDGFARAEKAAGIISRAKRDAGIDASVNFTLMKDTMAEFDGVKRLADDLGLPVSICLLDDTSKLFRVEENAKKFWIREGEDLAKLDGLLHELRRTIRCAPRTLLLTLPGVEYIRRYFRDPLQKQIPCVSSQDRIVIDPYGNFLGGCLSMGSFGNVTTTPLAELRRSPRYVAAKRNMFYKNCPGCSCGYLFNLKCLPGLVMRDLAGRMALPAEKEPVCAKRN